MHLLPLLLLATWTARADPVAASVETPSSAPEPMLAEPAGGPDLDPRSDPFPLVLEHAKTLYVEGHHRESLVQLDALWSRLEAGEPVPAEFAAEAAMYRGEVQFKLGDIAASWSTFQWILRRDPDLVMSPYQHHADVVAQFDVVKRAVHLEIAALPDPPPPRLQWWGVFPLGVPQLAQGQVGRGVLYGSLQIGFGITSIAMHERLRRINRPNNPAGIPDRDVAKVVQRERYLIQWPATVLAYAFLGVSILDGYQHYRQRPTASVAIAVDPGRAGVLLRARF